MPRARRPTPRVDQSNTVPMAQLGNSISSREYQEQARLLALYEQERADREFATQLLQREYQDEAVNNGPAQPSPESVNLVGSNGNDGGGASSSNQPPIDLSETISSYDPHPTVSGVDVSSFFGNDREDMQLVSSDSSDSSDDEPRPSTSTAPSRRQYNAPTTSTQGGASSSSRPRVDVIHPRFVRSDNRLPRAVSSDSDSDSDYEGGPRIRTSTPIQSSRPARMPSPYPHRFLAVTPPSPPHQLLPPPANLHPPLPPAPPPPQPPTLLFRGMPLLRKWSQDAFKSPSKVKPKPKAKKGKGNVKSVNQPQQDDTEMDEIVVGESDKWGDCTICFLTPTFPMGCISCFQMVGCRNCCKEWVLSSANQTSQTSTCPLCRKEWGGKTIQVLPMNTIDRRKRLRGDE